jgi:16S rRNA (cytidine1402-2'-O)-methyltransferase
MDISLRALLVLRNVDFIAAEDTRVTTHLLSLFDIHNKRLISCHDHNELSRVGSILECLKRGNSVALVADAGTPGICDPGYKIVEACYREKISGANEETSP